MPGRIIYRKFLALVQSDQNQTNKGEMKRELAGERRLQQIVVPTWRLFLIANVVSEGNVANRAEKVSEAVSERPEEFLKTKRQ